MICLIHHETELFFFSFSILGSSMFVSNLLQCLIHTEGALGANGSRWLVDLSPPISLHRLFHFSVLPVSTASLNRGHSDKQRPAACINVSPSSIHYYEVRPVPSPPASSIQHPTSSARSLSSLSLSWTNRQNAMFGSRLPL